MTIRYYIIETYLSNNFMFFQEVKAALYNDFICVAFSVCSTTTCSGVYQKDHYSSFFILNYPNNTDNNYNLIQHLFEANKNVENDFCFNLEGTLELENNLFGYAYAGVQIIDYPNNIYLKKNEYNIEKNSILLKDECILLSFNNKHIYESNNYSIEFAYYVKEPDYDDIKLYANITDISHGNEENEKSSYSRNNYLGKSSFFNIIINEDLTTECLNDSCTLCYLNNNNKCVTCRYNYTINNDHEKICLLKEEDDGSNCSTRNIIKGKCDEKIYDKQIREVYDILREDIKGYNGKIICTENVIFEMTLLNEQEKYNQSISYVDLGICEERIKKHQHLTDDDELIIFKIEMKNNDSSLFYIQYEIYDPNTLEMIPLSICKDILINIDIPFDLEEPTKSLYFHLNESGYNLFNIKDSFYNDICSTYTTQNNTDLTMADRKNIIFDNKGGNMRICQNNCTFKYYNISNRIAKCECNVQEESINTNILGENFEKVIIVDDFYKTLLNSNFLVLKCYKLVFSLEGQIYNLGSYIMLTFIILLIVLLIIYIIKGESKIDYYLNIIKRQILFQDKIKVSKFNNFNGIKKLISNKEKKDKNKNKESSNNIVKHNLFKKRTNNKKSTNVKNAKIENSTSSLKKNSSSAIINPTKKKKNKINQIISPKKNNVKNIHNDKKAEKNKIEKRNFFLNDEEINNLKYKNALLKDKRTFFQYYCSLLKKKHLLSFSFFPINDYNLKVVKLSLFLISYSLYFTLNGFFFSDKTMNKINQDNGNYNFITQVSIIIYSSVVSSIISHILKLLSLTEKKILELKKVSSSKKFLNQSNETKSCLKIKFIIFFIISFLLMFFFWYFISCFCAVYRNTQILLIEDTLISFGISMLYPFGLNLIPSIFRIVALRAKKKDKNILYSISLFLALI